MKMAQFGLGASSETTIMLNWMVHMEWRDENLGVVRTILESNHIQYSESLGWQFMCLYDFRFPMNPGYPSSCDYCSFLVNANLALHEDSVQAYIQQQKAVLFAGGVDEFTKSTLMHCLCSQEDLSKSLIDYAWYLNAHEGQD